MDNAGKFEFVDVATDDGWVIIHTAAVAGRPRGALLTHGNLISANISLNLLFNLSAEDVHLNLLPLFHVAGLFMATGSFHAGALNVNMDKFDEIYNIFSKEAIWKGSFDKFIESSKGKKGTAQVDDEFLKDIEKWREELAKNIASRNKDLSTFEINFAVQTIIDRILFLRICEDRSMEKYKKLSDISKGNKIYKELKRQEKEKQWEIVKVVFAFCALMFSMYLDPEFWRFVFYGN